ncbi:MAG: radical SAM protein [Candidatus Eremiobacteraeota bacterium]|nr:radical SAM protein [Candidatus Eremiobacteraeota bacterium]
MNLWEKFKSLFKKHEPLSPGTLHMRGEDGGQTYRLHLRIDPGGKGTLIINAARIIHLNQTATEYARHLIKNDSRETVAKEMTRRYHVSKDTVLKDYDNLKETIRTLVKTGDICPITYLDAERVEPFTTPVSSPYRMDLAMTYSCNNRCSHCYVPGDRLNIQELSTDQWKEVLNRLWEIGIPHVCFTGGEATLREDLVELVEHAENLGIVTGLLTNGRRLSDQEYVKKLVEAGLDHFQITLETHIEEIHDQMVGVRGAWKETVAGLKNALDTDVYTITNTTLTTLNADSAVDTVEFLADTGVEVFAMNGIIYAGRGEDCGIALPEVELGKYLEPVRKKALEKHMRFIWYTPTRYCNFDPVGAGLGPKQCSAAKANMCIEPNGDVLPCQSYYQPVGNILKDPWDKIWNAPLCNDIRERKNIPDMCRSCKLFPICGGGCPLWKEGSEFICRESKSAS